MAIGHALWRVRMTNHAWLNRVLRRAGDHGTRRRGRIHSLLGRVRASHRRMRLHGDGHRSRMRIWWRDHAIRNRRRYASRRVAGLNRRNKLRAAARVSHRRRRSGRRNAGRNSRRNSGHWRAIGRRLEGRWWYRIVWRVRCGVHGIVRSRILRRRREGSL